MIIDKVKITNFFCFLDTNIFEFKKGLNIISASNGAGKSQLFNAFYWTFFDKIYVDKDGQLGKKEWKSASNVNVCPDNLIEECREGETITSSIEIMLTNAFHENDEIENNEVQYVFTKTVIYKKSGNELIQFSKPELIITYDLNGETEYIQSHHHTFFLEKIFPNSIRKFMWYQGETMDNLYDFSNNITLRNAINEISYYPIYDTMEKIVISSSKSIQDKITKELSKQNKLGNQEQMLFQEIIEEHRNIESKESQILKLSSEISSLEEEIVSVEDQFKGFDEFLQIKTAIVQYESELQIIKEKIENLNIREKESLINKWMLNGCQNLIEKSRPNLDKINLEIQQFHSNTNPVPISLPGPEYIEKMLEDHICYICERPVEDNTDSYQALKRRLNDFELNSNHRTLQDNYTELNKSRARLNRELPGIVAEINDSAQERENLIKKRNSINKKLRSIHEEVGDDQRDNIFRGATNASQLTNKLSSLRQDITRKIKSKDYLTIEVQRAKVSLREKQERKDDIVKKADSNLVESEAAEYIYMFVKSIGLLRDIAYNKLITEIQTESNRLYSLYLGGKEQGIIEIGEGIRIVDSELKEVLTNLNTGELVAQKLAVANSFLSLSSKKLNKSYPIIADAPTSELDAENTYNLTLNLGNSFEQIIIMSKDYKAIPPDKINDLIKEASIAKFYDLENRKINAEGSNSRVNKKSYIKIIK